MTIRNSAPVKLRSPFQASIASILLGVSCAVCGPPWLAAQSLGAGTVKGIVTDATGAALSSATIGEVNTFTGYSRQAANRERTAGSRWKTFLRIPVLCGVKREGFQTWTQTVAIRTTVPIELKIQLPSGRLNRTVSHDRSPEWKASSKTPLWQATQSIN